MEDLGRRLSSHRVDGGRYWRTVGAALACVSAGVAIAAVVVAVPTLTAARPVAYAALATLLGLPIAVVQLGHAVRSGRDEHLDRYEHGLVHRTARRRRAWRWAEITRLSAGDETAADRVPVTPIDRLVRTLGWRYGCRVRFADGGRLRFDEYTSEAVALGRALRERRPDAVSDASRAVLLVPAGALVTFVGTGAALVLAVRFLASPGADGLGGSASAAIILGLVAGLTVCALSFGVLVMTAISVYRDLR
ncbi:hypothetical protein [Catenuloplanes atrovinosus]|uniref:PH domain-containing protein n=1 Tax=Catenuloplanes atrovinosus TaxID=137266 RepID=A0AAE3YMD0_9ACTN|nr:hypothetical protein [Catenuloplanes atrovinosus]MDR7275110.1 hypothetical protein [Catenuloplanes atrovinosus]